MRLYEGEGRHEEQSGSGRQADITNRAQMMMMTGMSAALTLLVAANTVKHNWPFKGDKPWQSEFQLILLDQNFWGKIHMLAVWFIYFK